MRYYEPCKVTKLLGDQTDFFDPGADNLVRQLIEYVVKCEGPISLDLASKRVAAHWGFEKVSSRVKERVSKILSSTSVHKTESNEQVFLWPINIDPTYYRIFRVPSDSSATRRQPEDLPPEEIANAALYVLEAQISMQIDDLVIETARLFGFARTGRTVADTVRQGIKTLLKRGHAIEKKWLH
jgi:hypothetical protein